VDALGRAVTTNELGRRGQVAVCEKIVEEEVGAFADWLAESKVRPLIERMFEDVRALAAIEVRSFFRRCPDLSETQRDAVRQLADRLVGKLMHPCVATVRRESSFDSAAALADAFRDTRLSFNARIEASVAIHTGNTRPVGTNAEATRADTSSMPGGCPAATSGALV
jgi:glutamyl-tRNA reductase